MGSCVISTFAAFVSVSSQIKESSRACERRAGSCSVMMTDPIADMLTRIRNAQAVGKTTIVLPTSKLKRTIADILAREGWLAGAEDRPAAHPETRGGRPELVLHIRYRKPRMPWITSIQRISTPGRRVYVTRGAIPRVKGGRGMLVLSTPQGMLTNREALTRGIGGEVICEVY